MITLALQASPSTSSAPEGAQGGAAPADRATTFQPVEGGGEHRSGEGLLVAAYSIIWTILMVWLVMLWRKQARLNERLDGLEGAIVSASSRAAASAAKPAAAKADAPAAKLGGEPSSTA